jgi:RNA polymerase sigma-70 factor (ECF subfamily)
MSLTPDDISALYEQHADLILRFLMRRTFDGQVAVDLLAETFAVAYEKRRKFRGEGEARGWLFGIAGNLLADYFRSGAAERRAVGRLGVVVPHVDDEELKRIEDLAETAELRAHVANAMRGLSEDQRAAVELRVVQERGYDEIAQQLGVSEQVARARVSRGLKALRDGMEITSLEEVMSNV